MARFDNFSPTASSITVANNQHSVVPTFTNGGLGTSFTRGLKVSGDLELNGESIDTRLRRIEERLHIPHRNVKLEEQYENLKKIYQEYEDTIAAIKTWEAIKGST
jgi:hypothetical protein